MSSRALIIQEDLEPEVSWNMGGSIVQEIPLNDRKISLIADYFFTHFINQVIADRDASSSQIRFYNLDGRSYAESFQLEASYKFTQNISSKIAYKHYDVSATIDGELQSVPFISKNRFFLNTGYSSKYEKWTSDLTLQWYSKQRLPDVSNLPENLRLSEFSPDFFMLNAQVTRNFRNSSIYIGAENLLDFRQNNPIIDPENPFGDNFDASMSWGPIAGRMIYAGFRYTIN